MTQQQEWAPAPEPVPVVPVPPADPQAGPAATSGTSPRTPQQLPLGIQPEDVNGALHVLARSLVPLVAGVTVVVALLSAVVLPDGHGGSLADWLRVAVAMTVLAVGGRLVAEGSAGLGELAAAEGSIAVRVLPLVVTAALVWLTARAATRAERDDPSGDARRLWVRSGLTGATAGIALAAAAALASASAGFGVDVADGFADFAVDAGIGGGALGAFVGATLLVGLATGIARTTAAPAVAFPLPAALGAFATPQRSADVRAVLPVLRTWLVGLVATAAVAVVGAFLYASILTDGLEDQHLNAVAAAVVLGLNVLVVLVLAAFGVPLAMAATSTGGGEILEFAEELAESTGSTSVSMLDSKIALLALLVPAGVALAAAVRRTVRRPQVAVTAGMLQAAAVVGAVAGLAAALLVRISFTGSVSGAAVVGELSGSADGAAGPSLLWAPLLTAAWSVAAVWALSYGPTLALSLPPRVTRVLGGRQLRPDWAAALDGTGPAPAGRKSPGLRLAALVTAGLVALAAVAAGVVAVVNATVFTPEAAAEEYLDSVADADVEAVLSSLVSAPKATGQPFLTDEVLGGEDFTPISDVTVGEVESSDGTATVEVTWSAGGEKVEDSIRLETGDAQYGVFDNWRIAEALPPVTVHGDGDGDLDPVIGGEELADGEYLALPGQYTVHAGEHALLTAEDSTFVVGPDRSASPSLSPTVEPEAMSKARELVASTMADCATETVLPLVNCPFFTDSGWEDELEGARIEVLQQPRFGLAYDDTYGALEIVTERRGSVKLTGTETVTYYSLPEEKRPFERTWTFDLSGWVTSDGEDLEVEFE